MARGITLEKQSGLQESSMQALAIRITRLENMFQRILEKMDILLDRIAISQAESNPRQISLEEAKTEIKEYFDLHHGKKLYWSDLEEVLNIDLETVIKACNELEKEGKICATR